MSVQEFSKYKVLCFEETLQTPQSLGPAQPCPPLPLAVQITPPLLCCSQIQSCPSSQPVLHGHEGEDLKNKGFALSKFWRSLLSFSHPLSAPAWSQRELNKL